MLSIKKKPLKDLSKKITVGHVTIMSDVVGYVNATERHICRYL